MTDSTATRRGVLASAGTATVAALAGCNDVLGDSTTPTPLALTALGGTGVYVDPQFSLSVPREAKAVDSPGLAEVIVVPGDTDRSRSAIVHWLAKGRYVAFLGGESQDTWHDVKESGAYAAMLGEPRGTSESCTEFGSGDGHASGSVSSGGTTGTDCEGPDMLVAWHTETVPTATDRTTWEGTEQPSARQVFETLDSALAADR